MKMKPEHYEAMKDAIRNIGENLDFAADAYGNRGLTPKRFRWDVLRASGLKPGDSVGMVTGWPVYDYLNDTHIDTALRAVMRDLNLIWAAKE